MKVSLTLHDVLKTALAAGTVGFTFRTGLHPAVYADRGQHKCDAQPSSSKDVEEILRQLVSSREIRHLRVTGRGSFQVCL